MKKNVLSISLIAAVFIFVLQLPIGGIARSAQGQLAAALPSQDSYGVQLGVVVDQVVNNIHARIPQAKITHADILTIMCMESAGLVGKKKYIISNARDGGARGLTQVMRGTLLDYVRSRKGGFYLSYKPKALLTNDRYSIEAGALIFNHHLMKYIPRHGERGGRTKAAIAYNGGPGRAYSRNLPRETWNYAYRKLPRCMNSIKRGRSPVRSAVWQGMIAKVSELTGGTMKLNGQPTLYDIPNPPWQPDTESQSQNIAKSFWQSSAGQSLSRALGGQPQAQVQPPQQRTQRRESPLGQKNASWFDRLLGRGVDTSTESSGATLSCDESGGKVQLKWSCPSSTTISRGFGTLGASFDTHGAGTGLVSSDLVGGAEYILQCIKDHQLLTEAKCKPLVVESFGNNIADGTRVGGGTLRDIIPRGVVMRIEYDKGTIIWATLGTRSCKIEAGSSEGEGKSGGLRVGQPENTTIIKLECDTASGKAVKYKKIIVE